MARLSNGRELLAGAVGYALGGAALVTRQLLPLAPLLITPGTRPGLFVDPVRLPGPACPGDQLVAFCGRQPRPLAGTV